MISVIRGHILTHCPMFSDFFNLTNHFQARTVSMKQLIILLYHAIISSALSLSVKYNMQVNHFDAEKLSCFIFLYFIFLVLISLFIPRDPQDIQHI